MNTQVRVASEVWIAIALLHGEHPDQEDFSVKEIIDRVIKENITGQFRPGVQTHTSQHCVANKRPSPNNYRMLYETRRGRRRLFRAGENYHPFRKDGRILPDPGEIPEQYQHLLEWYEQVYCNEVGSPFSDFITQADPLLVTRLPRDLNNSELEEYAVVTEQLRFTKGFVTSLQMLDYAYNRLCELGTRVKTLNDNLRDENAAEVHAQSSACYLEIEVLTSFLLNETKTVTDMLKDLGIALDKESELHYLRKVRNFFVAHPRLTALMQGPLRITSIPSSGPAVRDIIGAGTYEPYMLVYYLRRLGLKAEDQDRIKQASENNEKLIKELRLNDPKHISSRDLLRLKAFGVRMPTIDKSFQELRQIIESEVLPKIREYAERARAFERSN